MVESEQLCDSLVVWISGFDIAVPHKHAHDFTDGVAMAQILNQLDPDYFSDIWLSRIKTGIALDNYRLKTNNLKKVLNQTMDYFKEVSGNSITGFDMPDVSLVSEMADKRHLGRMLQLMLGVAVNCPSKQRNIEEIMQLDENVQHVVMTAIQELMQHYQASSEGNDSAVIDQGVSEQVKLLETKLTDAHADKEEMAQRCHELDMQVALLHEEKANIQQENMQLQERLNQTENLEDPSSPASMRHSQMLNQIEALQEETYRLEASRDDCKLRCEVVERELIESQNKIEELSALAEESRLLKDEIDYLRSASDKAAKLEATIQTYKTKLKEIGDLRGQVKLLEERNTSFMERTVDLEEELKKANAARSQLETYKRQVIDLHNKLSEETRRADKSEFEIKTKTEKMKVLEAEKQRLVAERDSLIETNEELQLTQHQAVGGGFMNEQLLGSSDTALTPLEVKEKLIRLLHENKMLKLQQGEIDDERIISLTSDLELANARINELETDNRLSNQRGLELDKQVKTLQDELQVKGASSEDNQALRHKLKEHLSRLHNTNEELQKKKAYIESVEPQLVQGDKQIAEMKSLLKKKEEDMKAMEDRYKKYLEKAKSVIRTLDPNKSQQSTTPQIQKLKSELQEKDKLLKQMEKDQDKSKAAREQEEKLVVNAWYNMGMQLHRKAVDERLSHTSPGQSFLARQRQVSSSRRSHPGTVQRKENDMQRHRVPETLASWTYM
ncbi:protein Hook homolog 3-like isoform X1 [Clavelina lepadiformis]|uniref:Calponin-homology (CH) domain-containing protein n=1 Tax=Clavelina lepadiformis TaxID=159417 RepID=A0ABP0GAE1_CLALP